MESATELQTGRQGPNAALRGDATYKGFSSSAKSHFAIISVLNSCRTYWTRAHHHPPGMNEPLASSTLAQRSTNLEAIFFITLTEDLLTYVTYTLR